MIERTTIEEFIKLMVEHDLVELDLADGDQSITLRRAEPHAASPPVAYMPPAAAHAPAASPALAATADPLASTAPASAGGAAAAEPDHNTIDSPMVGTFYSRPSPDADAFVGPGANVQDSTVVCLIEAMKVYNEIKAECSGRIEEILVKDGDPVEYGQPLFRLAAG